MTDFENVGVLELASTGRSFRIEMKGGLVCYVAIRAVGQVLYGVEKSATIFKIKASSEKPELQKSKTEAYFKE